MSELEQAQGGDEFDPFADSKPDKAGSGAGVAWLALLVALAVAGWNGWQWWQARGGNDAQSAQAEALAQVRAGQQDLEHELVAVQQRQQAIESAGLGAEIDLLKGSIERLSAGMERSGMQDDEARRQAAELAATLEELQQRQAAAEAALAALAVRGEPAEKRIELAEVEFLLRMATERLQLFGDARGARQALRLADTQLADLDDPLYLPVRQAIAAAQLALGDMRRVDTVELTGVLAHLQARIPTLSFPGEDAPVSSVSAVADEEAEASIWQRFKNTLSSLVTVRRQVEEDPLISLADKDYLRQGLWLQYESARLALMRSDGAAFAAALQRADATLAQYFDADAQAVRDARERIAGLLATDLEVERPDISAPWATLRGLRADPLTAAPVEPADPPAENGAADG